MPTPSQYSDLTGDPEDYTLDRLEERLGREVLDTDVQRIVDELTEQLAREEDMAMNGPSQRHLQRGGKDVKIKEKHRRRANGVRARLSYYRNLLSRWPE